MSILGLPNEVFFQIFENLEGEDLFALAKSCRDLNIVATSCFISRCKITSPEVYMTYSYYTSRLLLSFLRISTLLTSTKHLRANVMTINDLDELERLVVKLSTVESVYLSLMGTPLNPMEEVHFIKAIHGLLTSIIDRSCERLHIDLGLHTSQQKAQGSYSLKSASGFSASLRRMLRKSPANKDIYDVDLPDTSKLSQLSISSVSLFDRSFLRWTIKLINASPITHLTLRNTHPSFFPWDDFLSGIHSTALSTFCIQDMYHQISHSSVATFLARHQNIDFLGCQGSFRDDRKHPKLFLPRLTKLASCCKSIAHILEDGTAFPSLRKIFLDLHPCECLKSFTPTLMNNALACVARCPNQIELYLDFNQYDDTLLAWLDVDVNDESRIERSLDHVVGLNVDLCHTLRAQSILVIPKWLSLFPALRLVSIRYYHGASKLNFIRSIIQACPQLETLFINQQSRALAAWLEMKE